MMGENTVKGIRVSALAQWKAYDSLPLELRRVFAAAPYDYAMPSWARELRQALAQGRQVRELRQCVIEDMCQRIMVEALKVYGPDHPDAQRSRLTRAA